MKSQKLILAKSSQSPNRKILYSQIIVTIRYYRRPTLVCVAVSRSSRRTRRQLSWVHHGRVKEPSQRQRCDASSLVYQIYHNNNNNNNITLGWKNSAKDKGAMPCPLHLAKGKGTMPFLGLSCLGERTQLKTKARCLVFCIMPKAKARCLSLVKSRQITRLPRVPCFLAGASAKVKVRCLSLVYHAWVTEPSWRQRRDALSFVSCQRQRRDAFPW